MKTEEKVDHSWVRIGDWQYYPDYGRMLHESEAEYFLDNRLTKLFNFLLEQEGQIVRREDLLEFVWNDVQVNEENLTKGIFDLRKFLETRQIEGIDIETIRAIGYRLRLHDKPALASRSKNWWLLALKSAVYLVLFLGFLVLFIRAINYEN